MRKKRADLHLNSVYDLLKTTKSKRSQSQIISTVLIILIVLASIVIVWQVVKRTVEKSAEEVGIEAFTTNLGIKEAKLWVSGGARVRVKRGVGEGNIKALNFIFEKEGGSEVITLSEKDGYKMPSQLEAVTYDFSILSYPNLFDIDKVSLVPMFEKKSGIEVRAENPEKNAFDKDLGLISWWKFDGDAKDSLGKNQGTVSGAIFIDDPERGKVASFNGVNNYVEIPSSVDMNLGTTYTVVAWIYPNDLLSTKAIFASDYQPDMWLRVETGGRLNGGAYKARSSEWPNYDIQGTNGKVTIGSWQQVAFTVNGVNLALYHNGVLDKSDTITSTFTTGGLSKSWIGYSGMSWSTQYFNGKIDDVTIFNRVLTGDEIKALYNNQKY